MQSSKAPGQAARGPAGAPGEGGIRRVDSGAPRSTLPWSRDGPGAEPETRREL